MAKALINERLTMTMRRAIDDGLTRAVLEAVDAFDRRIAWETLSEPVKQVYRSLAARDPGAIADLHCIDSTT